MLERIDLVLVPLGVVAGALTTLAGLGGGLLLLAVLSYVFDPRTALAITAPALMLGNLHRATLYRSHIDRSIATRVGGAGFAAALLFGFLAVRCPDWLLRGLLLGATAFALGRATNIVRLRIDPRWLVPMGAIIGAVTATSGGGPALLAPTLLASGLSGERYVSTAAVCALSVHVGRVVAYGSSGLLGGPRLAEAALLGAFVLVGNAVGATLRPRFVDESLRRLELGALVVVLVSTLVGFGR